MMSHRYTTNKAWYGPTPAPTLMVLFEDPTGEEKPIEREALVDTGASNCVVTEEIVRQLKLPVHNKILLRGPLQ